VAKRIHVAIHVKDLPAAVAFYRAMFAAEPVRDLPDFAKFVLDEPLLNLALTAAPDLATGPGVLSHLGLQVETAAEVAAWGARWDAAGLPTKYGKSVADHDKVWVYDPDGNEWEVFAE
jgi:catechol 2,3-dioxygenase-like lactoylglutathione lyase family enzyme